MIKYPKIGQFREVIRNVAHETAYQGEDEDGNPIMDRTLPLPTLPYRGTVKLHGSNASVVISKDAIVAQSRNRVLSVESDNAGFAMFALGVVGQDVWRELATRLLLKEGETPGDDPVIIYGEWCGGNVQGGVALEKLPKMFVVFGVKIGPEDERRWVDIRPSGSLNLDDEKIYSIYDERFPVYDLDINFESPELSRNKMIEITIAVEECCPVGKALGAEGIGEGVVWSCASPGLNNPGYWFKVKGEKHSASKVKTLAPVDIELVKSVNEFVDRTLTENRCNQGIEYLKEHGLELTQKSTGEFIKWIVGDCIREELDTLVESGLDGKAVAKPLGGAARDWFFSYLKKTLGF